MNRNYLFRILVFWFFLVSPSVQAAIFNVTTTEDPTPDPTANPCALGDCSLREAVISANSNAQDDTIALQAITYHLRRQGAGENAAATGDLDIGDSPHTLTISGISAQTTIIDATGLGDRIFDVVGFEDAFNLTNLTLQNGNAGLEEGGAIVFGANGGFGTTINISDSRLIGNKASRGGAIRACCNTPGGSVTILRSLLFDNSASQEGGGLYINNSIPLTILESTIDLNQAGANGGGIFAASGTSVILNDSTVSNNTAGSSGGGLFYQSGNPAVSANNSTFSGNRATTGGAISMQGLSDFKLRNVTITGNSSSGQGAGIHIPGGLSTSNITNSILAGNSNGFNSPDCFIDGDGSNVDFTSLGFNVFGDVSDCGLSGPDDLSGVNNPGLDPLGDNGGITLTHLPLLGSPAIDHGNPAGCKNTEDVVLSKDQRGEARLQGAACDSGSVESTPVTPAPATPSPSPSPDGGGNNNSQGGSGDGMGGCELSSTSNFGQGGFLLVLLANAGFLATVKRKQK